MPGYNRFVSYLYNYEKQIKSDNVGYARVETRNGQCKITIHLKILNLKVNSIPVYACIRKKGKLQGILLGDIVVNQGTGEVQIVTRDVDIMESGIPLSSIVCMVIYYSDDKFFATEWDDEPISIRGFKKYEQNITNTFNQEEKSSSLPEVISNNTRELEEIQKPEPRELQEQLVNIEELQGGVNITEEIVKKEIRESVHVVEEKETEIREPETKIQEIKVTEPIQESREENEIKIEEITINKEERSKREGIPKLNSAEKIFAKCPTIQPFGEGKVIACVKFQPEDIGLLPMEYWTLGNNSFLMHGYFSYRHLIFAKKTDGNKILYLLGVPGIMEKNEESLAGMFGFKQFLPLKKQVNEQRELGYWYMPINL